MKVTTKEEHCEPDTKRLHVSLFEYAAAAFVVIACDGDDGERDTVKPDGAHMSSTVGYSVHDVMPPSE